MVAGLVVLVIFLACTFVTGYCLARMRSLSDENEILRGVVQTRGVSGGASVDQSAVLDVATPTEAGA